MYCLCDNTKLRRCRQQPLPHESQNMLWRVPNSLNRFAVIPTGTRQDTGQWGKSEMPSCHSGCISLAMFPERFCARCFCDETCSFNAPNAHSGNSQNSGVALLWHIAFSISGFIWFWQRVWTTSLEAKSLFDNTKSDWTILVSYDVHIVVSIISITETTRICDRTCCYLTLLSSVIGRHTIDQKSLVAIKQAIVSRSLSHHYPFEQAKILAPRVAKMRLLTKRSHDGGDWMGWHRRRQPAGNGTCLATERSKEALEAVLISRWHLADPCGVLRWGIYIWNGIPESCSCSSLTLSSGERCKEIFAAQRATCAAPEFILQGDKSLLTTLETKRGYHRNNLIEGWAFWSKAKSGHV